MSQAARILRSLVGALVVAALLPAMPGLPLPVAAAVPPGFSDTAITSLGSPTDLAFTPDGRMLITTQPGRLRVYADGALASTPALDLAALGTVCSNVERGMLGVAVDPEFATYGYIYLYYTFKKHGGCATNTSLAPVHRVSRFTLSPDSVVDPASELVLIDNIPSPNGTHNAGDLHVAADGLLYVTVGDGGCKLGDATRCAAQNDNSRHLDTLLGKVLRIGRDGTIPAGNPYAGAAAARRCGDPAGIPSGTGPCSETFASGLRNPFRFAFRPGSSEFHINDVGQNTWEEINLGVAGADYGWNVREGHCALGSTTSCGIVSGLTNPIHDYPHSAGCQSVTGAAFVPAGIWPAEFDDAYLFADYVCGKIFRLLPSGSGGYSQVDFVTGLGASSAVAMAFGPHGATQALFYTTYAGGGSVRRISYDGQANQRPIAAMSATPMSGPAPLSVGFDGSGSRDPDGDPLTYHWDFGDGVSTIGSSPVIGHTYSDGGYTATLHVEDGLGGVSDAVQVQIAAGDTPPSPRILSPSTSVRFAVGQTITLTGSASDASGGAMPDAALSWTVLVHHDAHTHPFLGPTTGNRLTFSAPPPEDLAATKNSFLEIRLTATDPRGLSSTVSQELRPRLVNLKFATSPTGLRLTLNGESFIAPKTYTSWQGWKLNVRAANQTKAARNYSFVKWSDGGAAAHTITTPASAKTYTATFRRRS